MVMRFFIFSFLFALCFQEILGAEAKLEIPSLIAKNQEFTVKLMVSDGSIKDIRSPNAEGLTLKWVSQQSQNINGRTSMTLVGSGKMARTGNITILPLVVVLADKSEVMTAPVECECVENIGNYNGGLGATLTAVPPQTVIGGRISLRYRVFIPDESNQMLDPNWTPSLPSGIIAEGGSWQPRSLLPDSTGRLYELSEYRLEARVNTFDALISDTVTIGVPVQTIWETRLRVSGKVQFPSLKLVVRNPPTEGRPADWTGLVGQVTVSARLDHKEISAGEGTTLTVVIEGQAADTIDRPVPEAPAGCTLTPRPDRDKQQARRRIFVWNLVPSTTGTFTVPPISLPWFDVVSGEYRRSASDALTLKVSPGRSLGLTVVGNRLPSQVDVGTTLPAPVGKRSYTPGPQEVLTVALTAIILTAGIALLPVLWSKRRPHRGRRLAAAVNSGDANAIAQALTAFRGEPGIAELQEHLDRLRFSGQHLDTTLQEALKPWEARA
jgi:hypothetical protein